MTLRLNMYAFNLCRPQESRGAFTPDYDAVYKRMLFTHVDPLLNIAVGTQTEAGMKVPHCNLVVWTKSTQL